MRYFEHFPKDDLCPICETNDDGKYFLIAVYGTKKGNKMQAIPVHSTCFVDDEFIRGLLFDIEHKIIYRPL